MVKMTLSRVCLRATLNDFNKENVEVKTLIDCMPYFRVAGLKVSVIFFKHPSCFVSFGLVFVCDIRIESLLINLLLLHIEIREKKNQMENSRVKNKEKSHTFVNKNLICIELKLQCNYRT